MHDIFLSYSSLDKKYVEKVCEQLENAGFSCWASYRIQDLQPGKIYTQRITEAIDSSRIFILLLSNNSIQSEQVQQEIISANERQRFGLKLIAIQLDSDIDMDAFHRKMGYVFAGKERFCWEDSSARGELFNEIHNFLNAGRTADTARIITHIPDNGSIVGRTEEMHAISDALCKSGKLWVSGIGGIGKTALLTSYCKNMHNTKYSAIVYLTVEKCIARALDNDHQLVLQNEFIDEKRKILSNYEYALYKLSVLENSANASTLVVVDNIEDTNDSLLERISNLQCDVIIASRHACPPNKGFGALVIREITQKDTVHELFGLYYGKKLSEREYCVLDELLAGVRFHTMTVVLIAKQMRYFCKQPSDYKNRNQLTSERTSNLSQIMSETVTDSAISEMYIRLFDLFDATTLTQQEKAVMKTLCLLPVEGMHRHLYIRLIGETYLDAIIKLEKMGWIQNDPDSKFIFLHPLVRDVVLHELNLFLDDPDIAVFFANFIESIADCWNRPYVENAKFKEVVLSIYFQFPHPTLGRYRDYLTLSKLLWVLNYMDISLEIQNKVKRLFADKHLGSSEEADALLQIGFTYQSKGAYESAAQELMHAAQIYGNKYAAALSHLAQARMLSEDGRPDEIEPLLKDSLSIRERYWKGTISEAASCHLYAKFLSFFNYNLNYAISLEKRAYQIFTKLQPNGVNVSSAAYILGWLFIQTAEDEGDIEYGIEKLEEAKKIRLNYRGDPLHPWMEDIYLKLGQAYEKYGEDMEALEYYKLLLKVRERKYQNDCLNPYIIENYKFLQRIYEKLGDVDGQKMCRKYLRYLM